MILKKGARQVPCLTCLQEQVGWGPRLLTLRYTRCPTENLHNHVSCYQERAPGASLRQQPPPLAPQLDLTIKTRLPDWAGYYRDRILLYVYLTDSCSGSDPNYIYPICPHSISPFQFFLHITSVLIAYNLCSFLVSIRSEFVDNLSHCCPSPYAP